MHQNYNPDLNAIINIELASDTAEPNAKPKSKVG